MQWRVALRCIKANSAAIRRHREAFDATLKTLLAFLDHEDALVAYAAKEELWKVLIDDNITDTRAKIGNEFVTLRICDFVSCSFGNVRTLILTTVSRRESSAFRFQLLRQLIPVKIEEQSMERGNENEGQLGYMMEHTYVQAVLKNLRHVRNMVHSVLVTADHSGEGVDVATIAPYSVQYEAIVFLSDFVKQLHGLKIEDRYQVELSEHMVILMDDVFVAMDYVSQPAFVSCAVLGLLGGFHELVQFWASQKQNDASGCSKPVLVKWLERSLVWFLQSSCTSTALRLLHDDEHAHVTSQMAFISKSSRYPFLQQWLLYLSRMGIAYVEAMDTLQMPVLTGEPHCCLKQLPSRQQIFTVLAEQDDVMIEVLSCLMQMTIRVGSSSSSSDFLTQWCPTLTAYVTAEFDPDLLFADLVQILERDHLVLLDLLVTNETQMLEYFVTYLRHLNTRWDTSKQKLQVCGQLESVLSVLIRLRLEIDRLVAADLFPYNAAPLTRRMLAIEQLYEEP